MKNILLLMGVIMLTYCAVTKKGTTHVVLHGKEDSLLVKSSAPYVVEIPIQSGTGYSWEFDALSVQSKLIGKSMAEMPDSTEGTPLPGRTMLEVFSFKAPSSFKEETLVFTLRRAWEKNGAPAQVRQLRVKKL